MLIDRKDGKGGLCSVGSLPLYNYTMSYKNPTVTEVLANSVDNFNMSKHFHKSYLNLAKGKFHREQGRKATLDDAQELFYTYVVMRKHDHITKPLLNKMHRKIGMPVWEFGCKIRIDVQRSTCEFVRVHNPTFKGVFDYNYASWIIRNNLFTEYVKYAKTNKSMFRYHKPRYVDYSHMAYNNSSDNL